MTTSLISLLRLVNSGEELITLSRELDYVQNYAAVMSFRRNRNFRIATALEPGTGDCRIPKFSLQPFVENSIIHGFAGTEKETGEYRISIHAFFKEEQLCVRVEDNGRGFRPEETAEKPEENGIRFSHVGISNVEERIRLYFGNRYEIKIESTPGAGTTVILTLPGRDIGNGSGRPAQ